MAPQERHAFCFKVPRIEEGTMRNYNNHAGELVFTLAVSPAQAANNAIYSTFHLEYKDRFNDITKYLHASFNVSQLTLDIDELDRPVRQSGLFGGTQSSHRRLDETKLAKKISKRFDISDEGENSTPKQIARKYIKYRREHPLGRLSRKIDTTSLSDHCIYLELQARKK